ncbi:MAG TPA: carbonic anhydrase [Candidatus Baltobacteraceae bacterium]|jgi:carbonic anhydrase|nr:carbonic anhydrase [Candidatus Baltobacteraceae bacterium]
MRLFEAVLAANQRALAGDPSAGVRIADYTDELPIVALTCIDPRLNRLLPGVLGLPDDKFIWLRNAGNIITGPLSSTMRSLALACAIKGGREIAVIGHTDCHVRQTTAAALLEKFKALGVGREKLPDNLTEYFGLFAGERQNVIRGVDIIRSSPLISPRTFVQGLMVDIQTGSIDWVVNGYEMPPQVGVAPAGLQFPSPEWIIGSGAGNNAFEMGEMKSSDLQIGETAGKAVDAPVAAQAASVGTAPATPPAAPPILAAPQRGRSIPLPPPIRMRPGKRP